MAASGTLAHHALVTAIHGLLDKHFGVGGPQAAALLDELEPDLAEAGRSLRCLQSAANVRAAELQLAEARLQGIMEIGSDGLIGCDPGGAIRYWNGAARQLFGWPPHGDPNKLAELFPAGLGEAGQVVGRRADGRCISLQVRRAELGARELVYAVRPVTAASTLEQTLRRQRAAIEGSLDGMAFLGEDGCFLQANGAFKQLCGLPTTASLRGRSWSELYGPDAREVFRERVFPALASNSRWRGEIEGQRKDGSCYFHAHSLELLEDGGHLWILRDISEQRHALQAIERLSQTDPLTGLANQEAFSRRLASELERARHRGRAVAVAYLDLDHFQNICDSLDHSVGDCLLRGVGHRLADKAGEGAMLARMSADAFLVMFPGLRQDSDCTALIRPLMECFETPFRCGGRELFITASIGVSLFPRDGETPENLLRNADAAMHQAKAAGRHRVVFFRAEMNQHAHDLFHLENCLRHALTRNELQVHYQPLVGLKNGRIRGAEALLRWNHAELGSVSPARFVPLAERSDIIVPIGRWVLRQACEQLRLWERRGLDLEMSVNLSAREIRQHDLASFMVDLLEETGVPAQKLHLEMTERNTLEVEDGVLDTLHQLKSLGLRLAVDDFGTGCSSLSYLRNFPINTVKIDRSFIRDLASKRDDQAITSAVIALSHSLDLTVVAEGVETREQLGLLRSLGCDMFQGFLVSRAVTAPVFDDLLDDRLLTALTCF